MAKAYSIALQLTAKDAAGKVVKGVQLDLEKLIKTTKSVSKANSSMWSQMKAYAGGQMLYNTVSRVANFMFDAVRESEDAIARFVPKFGGDMKKTKAFVDALNKSAAETPFQFNDLASAADTLMGFGVASAENVIQTMNMLGDVAGGNAQRMQSIVLAYSQSMAAGKANMQDINQLINAGVPILGELAKMYKVNVGVMRDMISRGKIMSTDIDKAFKRMTQSGGMFFEGMKIQSKTLSGQLSTLQDNLKQAAAKAAGPIIKTFTPVLNIVGDVVSAFANMPTSIQGGLIAAGAAIAIFAGGVKAKLGGVLALIGAIKMALDEMNNTEEDILKADIAGKKAAESEDRYNQQLKDLGRIKDALFDGVEGTNQYNEQLKELYAKYPQVKDIVTSKMEFGKFAEDANIAQIQTAIQEFLRSEKEKTLKEKRSVSESLSEAETKNLRLIANPMYSRESGLAGARQLADIAVQKSIMLPQEDTGKTIKDRLQEALQSIKEQDDSPVYIKAFSDRANELMAGLKDQKSNIDVNIRVDQEGNVTTANASAKSTGVNLRQSVRFNP